MQGVVPEQRAGLSLFIALETCAGSPSGFVPGPIGVRLELFYEMVVVTEISSRCLSLHVLRVTCRGMSCSILFLTHLLQLKGIATSDCRLAPAQGTSALSGYCAAMRKETISEDFQRADLMPLW